jgi:Tol biopolymer transport system component
MTDDSAADYSPAVSPDGRYLVYLSSRSGIFTLWRADIDGSNQKQLTTVPIAAQLDFSSDGRWVIFANQESGPPKLHKVSIDGGSPVPLTDQPLVGPAVSPDGKLIACFSFDPQANQRKLVILPFEGGAPLRTLEIKTFATSGMNQPRWTPDGRALIYIDARQGGANLWRLQLDGSPLQPVTNFNDAKPETIYSFDLTRDGKQLVIARGSQSSDVVLINEVK